MNIINFLQGFSNPILDKSFTTITMMGEETFFILFIALIFWCINKRVGYKLGFAVLSGSILNNILKITFHTKRPIGEEGIRSLRVETATGSSFPSGHTQGTAELWTVIAREFKNIHTYILAIIFILLVATSRLYLGVHWPIDVVFGAIIGVVWSTTCCWLFDLSIKRNNKLLLLTIIIPCILTVFFYGGSADIKTVAILISFFIGYYIEDRYIKFDEKATLSMQVIKYTLGISTLLFIKQFLKVLLPTTVVFDFIRYNLIGLWITCGSTYIFQKLLLCNNKYHLTK
ncbi:MAG: phosphatase PAP2 family protein [Clostridiaceae bacterium]|nr:phosphatase PAP2 family protein [Clostridiaceae bacterium]